MSVRSAPVGRLVGIDWDVAPACPVTEHVADRARRYVASRATDAADCALLLDALGLLPETPVAAPVPASLCPVEAVPVATAVAVTGIPEHTIRRMIRAGRIQSWPVRVDQFGGRAVGRQMTHILPAEVGAVARRDGTVRGGA